MNRAEAIKHLEEWVEVISIPSRKEAVNMAIKALQGDMYCPSCGVRLVSENEYVEPKTYKEGGTE